MRRLSFWFPAVILVWAALWGLALRFRIESIEPTRPYATCQDRAAW
jgi:hypothetical protein